MRPLCFAVLATLILSEPVSAQAPARLPHPDSVAQPGVPQGEIKGPFEWKSQIFPGTVRNYWMYVPKQYDPSKATCVLVLQDGLRQAQAWNVPTALDNLIHKKEVPVQIGIFINPGVIPPVLEGARGIENRSFEYDSVGDRYVRFLIDEILPEVGKSYNLSSNPDDRCIGGASSGAICAFNAAWERPDQFHRVLSTIGTYVGMRGGDDFATLVRKFEPKPLRVFLQDGSNDQNVELGNWWLANQSLLSALEYSGYDVTHAWDEEAHSSVGGAAVMPEMLRWLWRGYPEPIKAGFPKQHRMDILLPGEGWQLVGDGFTFTEGPAPSANGDLYFTDMHQHRIHKLDPTGKITLFAENTGRTNGLMFGTDGLLYGCAGGANELVRYNVSTGQREVLFGEVNSNDIATQPGGGFYFTNPRQKQVIHVDKAGNRKVVDTGITQPNGLALSPDRSILWVGDTDGRFIYQFQIQPDGSLANKQPFGYLHVADDVMTSKADGMTVDSTGRVYVTTDLGLQILDTSGRVRLILDRPQDKWLANVKFGGPNLDTLYVTCSDKVYKRKVKAKGVPPLNAALSPAAGR